MVGATQVERIVSVPPTQSSACGGRSSAHHAPPEGGATTAAAAARRRQEGEEAAVEGGARRVVRRLQAFEPRLRLRHRRLLLRRRLLDGRLARLVARGERGRARRGAHVVAVQQEQHDLGRAVEEVQRRVAHRVGHAEVGARAAPPEQEFDGARVARRHRPVQRRPPVLVRLAQQRRVDRAQRAEHRDVARHCGQGNRVQAVAGAAQPRVGAGADESEDLGGVAGGGGVEEGV